MLTAFHTTSQFGQLAFNWCKKELPLQVCSSRAGFYIGTIDDQCGPCSRESAEYFGTRAQAENALASGNWTQRSHP